MNISELLRNVRTLQAGASSGKGIALGALFVMGGVGSLLEAVGIALIFPFISLLNTPEIVKTSALLSRAYEILDPSSFRQFAIFLGIGIALVFILKNLFMVWLYYLQAGYAARQRVHLANRLFRLYLLSPYVEHQRRNSSELIRNIANLVEGPYSAFIIAQLGLIADALAILGIVAVLLVFQPYVTLASGLALGLLFVFQGKAFSPLFHRLGSETATLAHEQQEFLQRSLGGFKETKALSREPFFLDGFRRIQDRFAGCMKNYQFANRLPPIVSEVVFLAVILGVIAVVVGRSEHNDTALASLALLAGATFRLLPLMNRVIGSLNSIRHSSEGISILAGEVAALEAMCPSTPPTPQAPAHFDKDLRLDAVTFRYPGAEANALDHVSLTIRKGEFVGLVGRTGAGKTTLADILLGLLDFDEGRMIVDDVDITHNLGAWRTHTGYVPQDIFIINDTLRRNVAFGLPDDAIEDSKVRTALRLAQLDEFVAHQPNGLDTMLGERGVTISGGQRQRIGIARALYHDPDILMFDEATSSLDTKTEQELTNALRELKGNKTMIVIAHRLSTIRDCDRLFFIQDGAITASGTYDELLSTHPEFAEMVHAGPHGHAE